MTANPIHVFMEHAQMECIATHVNVHQDIEEITVIKVRKEDYRSSL